MRVALGCSLTKSLSKWCGMKRPVRRLVTIPGIGTINATALVAAVGNARAFRRGRDMAAWLGLTPRQMTTGGKPRLLGISKRGPSAFAQVRRDFGSKMVHPAPDAGTSTFAASDPATHWEIIPRRPNSLADEPVQGEPVSGEDSLLTGKRTGNFVKIGPFGKKPPVRTQQNQLVAG